MGCSEYKLLIAEYFDDELSDLERQSVEEHILFCDTCYKEFVEMRELVTMLKQSLAPYRSTSEDCAALTDRLRAEDA